MRFSLCSFNHQHDHAQYRQNSLKFCGVVAVLQVCALLQNRYLNIRTCTVTVNNCYCSLCPLNAQVVIGEVVQTTAGLIRGILNAHRLQHTRPRTHDIHYTSTHTHTPPPHTTHAHKDTRHFAIVGEATQYGYQFIGVPFAQPPVGMCANQERERSKHNVCTHK